jgi:hypothetical protein
MAGFAGNAVKLHGLVDSTLYEVQLGRFEKCKSICWWTISALAGSNASNQLVSDLGYNRM